MDIHTERSQLINKFKSAVRPLEKQLQKGRLPDKVRAQCEEKLAELKATHLKELEEFDKKNEIVTKAKHNQEEHGSDTAIASTTDQVIDFNGLSVTALRKECEIRNLSSSGNREQLLTRLYTSVDAILAMNEKSISEKRCMQGETEKLAEDLLIKQKVQKARHRSDEKSNKEKKAWKNSHNNMVLENEGDAEAEQVRRQKESNNNNEFEKKRDFIIGVLPKLLFKNNFKLYLDEIAKAFEAAKIFNFSAEMLGYSSLEEWAESLPADCCTYVRSKQRLYHITACISDQEDDDSENSEDDEIEFEENEE